MGHKKVRGQDLFLEPQSPQAESVSEVVENWAKRKISSNSEKNEALPESPEEHSSPKPEEQGLVHWVEKNTSDVSESIIEYAGAPLKVAEKWSEQSSHIKVLQLYTELGHTDSFLRALYDKPEYLSAALDISFDFSVLTFLADPKLSTSLVDQFPQKAGDQLGRIFDFAPRGAALSEDIRKMLTRWVPLMKLKQIKPAFQARFDVELQREQDPNTNKKARWSVKMLRKVWLQLDVLPLEHVSENTVLEAFETIAGTGAFWSGGNTVQLGEDKDPKKIDHTVRHEIGHAVHSERSSTIDSWLKSEIQMWHFPKGTAGLKDWVDDLGGFPDKFTNSKGEEKSFSAEQENSVLKTLQSYLGGGSKWGPSRTNITAALKPSDLACWNAMPQTIQNAVTQSTTQWYNNYKNWQTGSKGKYFLNYWYAVPYYMSSTAEAVVNATGRHYTSMSYKEFFANCYAEYFKDHGGYADHSRWGGKLPGSVKKFMKNHVLDRQPYAPPKKSSPNKNGAGESPAIGITPPAATGEAGTP
ncbi:MAG: hypothetical protein CL916_02200 [Deltaproteobacteria bacterium]|nr:hypothetical protein [Deltaproteobacteria bacterium]